MDGGPRKSKDYCTVITRAEAWQLHKAVNTAKGNLCRHRDRNPTGGA